jgi:hypothetical protein
MSFILKLHITGLCGIVPVGGDVLVALPNARDYDPYGNTLPPSRNQDRHIPLLCVPVNSSTSTRGGSFVIPASSGLAPIDLLAYPLDEEDLSLMPVNAVPTSLRGPVGEPCPIVTKPNDFGWISYMADVKAESVLSAVTAGPFPKGLLLARLTIVNGTWSTALLAASPLPSDPRKYIIHWYYADMGGSPMPGSPNRAIADEIRVDVPIDDPAKVTFHSSTANSDIVLAGGGADLVAYLINVPLGSLLGAPVGLRTAEMHFAHFYRLAGKSPTWIPTPDLKGPNCGLLYTGTELVPHCPPARFGG